MSVQELIDRIGDYPYLIAATLIAIPLLAFLVGSIHEQDQGGKAPFRFIYAALIYAACIPGCFAAILTLYSLLFLSANLLKADVIIYFLPIITMVTTLGVMSRRVDFNEIPGFGRLSGLMLLLALSFMALFVLSRTRVWLIFGGGFSALVAIFVAAFALFKWGAYMFFRRRDEPEIDIPRFDR